MIQEEISGISKTRPFTPAEWDRLRYKMQDSMMVDTQLTKLAQSLGTKWPIRGKEETPRKYIGSTLDVLEELPEFFGKGNRLSLLYSILKDTQSLDDPFDDMVSHLGQVAGQDNEGLSALAEVEVPAFFPVDLSCFTEQTHSLCRAEEIKTVGELIEFTQKCAKSVFLGGELQQFLNGLMQRDRASLKRFLPLRENESGIFLAEALGHLVSKLSPSQAASAIALGQMETENAAWSADKALPKAEAQLLPDDLKSKVEPLLMLLPDQAQELRHALQSGLAPSVRFFASLRNADRETLAIAVARIAMNEIPKSKGFMKRFISG